MELEPPLLVGLEGAEPAGGNREQVGRGDLDLAGAGACPVSTFLCCRPGFGWNLCWSGCEKCSPPRW